MVNNVSRNKIPSATMVLFLDSKLISFNTDEKMDTKRAQEYAWQKLQDGSYKNCTIDKVYVNRELVFENVKIS